MLCQRLSSGILNQSLAQADYIVHLIVLILVEGFYVEVRGADLQIQFRAAKAGEGGLNVLHHLYSKPLALLFRTDCQIVN